MKYVSCGHSGLKIPLLSLGLWHHFGASDDFENARAMLMKAFDLGITYFDLANNYGTPAGSAEITMGKMLKKDFASHRDEIIITTKAGHRMAPGPLGIGGSKKHLVASLDQSLKRLGVDYVDVFLSHRFDETTPLEETMGAMAQIVSQGKALYIGFSTGYQAAQMTQVAEILQSLKTHCLVHMARYHLFHRALEGDWQSTLRKYGIGSIAFSPLAEGLLTQKYVGSSPEMQSTEKAQPTADVLAKITQLNDLAIQRGQTLSQMALAWVLREGGVQSAIIGASRPQQIEDNVAALNHLTFSPEELNQIDEILNPSYTAPCMDSRGS